jgi:hypothetical protein
VKVRRCVMVEEHSDQDSVEAADGWHPASLNLPPHQFWLADEPVPAVADRASMCRVC